MVADATTLANEVLPTAEQNLLRHPLPAVRRRASRGGAVHGHGTRASRARPRPDQAGDVRGTRRGVGQDPRAVPGGQGPLVAGAGCSADARAPRRSAARAPRGLALSAASCPPQPLRNALARSRRARPDHAAGRRSRRDPDQIASASSWPSDPGTAPARRRRSPATTSSRASSTASSLPSHRPWPRFRPEPARIRRAAGPRGGSDESRDRRSAVHQRAHRRRPRSAHPRPSSASAAVSRPRAWRSAWAWCPRIRDSCCTLAITRGRSPELAQRHHVRAESARIGVMHIPTLIRRLTLPVGALLAGHRLRRWPASAGWTYAPLGPSANPSAAAQPARAASPARGRVGQPSGSGGTGTTITSRHRDQPAFVRPADLTCSGRRDGDRQLHEQQQPCRTTSTSSTARTTLRRRSAQDRSRHRPEQRRRP